MPQIRNPQSAIPNRSGRSGTREWSEVSANCCTGCGHGCLYCYARQAALRFKKIAGPELWTQERPQYERLRGTPRRHKGVVMFPTQHDLTPFVWKAVGRDYLSKLLEAGNRVLVVSKAHEDVMGELGSEFGRAPGNLLEVRVTITGCRPETRRLWEPGAPEYRERIAALKIIHKGGIPTSVSMEPCLDSLDIETMLASVMPWCHEVWIGMANRLDQRLAWVRDAGLWSPELGTAIARIKMRDWRLLADRVERFCRACNTPPGWVQWKNEAAAAISAARGAQP
jgi:DNA repair photolyase